MDDGRNIKLPPPLSFSRSGFSRNSSYLDGPTNVTKAVQSKRNSQVMSLCAYCIKVLSLEEVHNLPDLESCWTQRSYESATMKRAVAELLPFLPPPLLTGKKQHKSRREPFRYKPDANDSVSVGSYIGKVHPQLWGLLNALIIPSTLPPILRHFSLPITDEHVPSLQASPILSTPTLSLLTHVSFSSTESRIQITDSSLIQLRNLSCLTVLDLAATPVTSSGVLRLIASMRALLPSKASPWRLRVLDLRRTFVDDEILLGDYRGLSLMAFPLLFAIDVRETSVSTDACKAFRRSWGSASLLPPELFHPTPAGRLMDRVSRLTGGDRSNKEENIRNQCEHAILLLDGAGSPNTRERQYLGLYQEGNQKEDHKLRLNTSGVVVLTRTAAILGNIQEEAGSTEEGSAQATFRQNNATIESMHSGSRSFEREYGLSRQEWEEMEMLSYGGDYAEDDLGSLHDTETEDISEHTESDQDDEGSDDSEVEPQQSLHELVMEQLKDDIKQGFVMYRDPPDLSLLSQLDTTSSSANGVKKRPRSDNETLSVKRFKGPILSQIFGASASSISSRRL